MPGRPKTGPPYNDPPPGTYVVVVNPWGMNPTSRERGQRDVDRVAAWAELVLREANAGGRGRAPRVECVYSMGTRNEIIIQFPLNTNVTPLLGEHRWATIARKWDGSPDDPRSSCVFVYNWRNHGDPANHNWSEWYPKPGQNVPARSPYPAPSWVIPPLMLTNFVVPIPRPPTPPPQLELDAIPNAQSVSQEQSVVKSEDRHHSPPLAKDEAVGEGTLLPRSDANQEETQPPSTANESLFRPYQPPSQHPSHGQFLNRSHQPSQPAESELKFTRKHDPYEVEEDAKELLRSFKPDPADEDTKPIHHHHIKEDPDSVKQEEPSTSLKYQPSAALLEAFNSLDQGVLTTPVEPPVQSQDPRKRPRPAPSNSYQPSAELIDAINSLMQGSTPLVASHPAPPDAQQMRRTVKREYVEEDLSGAKKIKREEF